MKHFFLQNRNRLYIPQNSTFELLYQSQSNVYSRFMKQYCNWLQLCSVGRRPEKDGDVILSLAVYDAEQNRIIICNAKYIGHH